MTNDRSRLLKAVRLAGAVLALLLVVALAPAPAAAQVRIKDIASFEGVRDNLLVGYGLVVGLNGSGDNLSNSPFTQQSIIGMLERLGVNIRGENFKPKNVAAVMVTATLPPFSRQGSRIDITVSAIGDAKSLQGGTLLVTPLMGADGQVYAVSQGPVAIAGFSAEGDAASVTKGTPTNGRIASGAVIEREVPFALADLQQVRIALHNPDFTTASRMAEVINAKLGGPVAQATDPTTVNMTVPQSYGSRRGAPHHRRRAAAPHPRPGLARRHRRAHRHHRHGRQRAHQHGRDLAGQPHGPHHRNAAGLPARAVQPARATPWWCRAPTSTSPRAAPATSPSSAAAPRSTTSSRASMRSASRRAT